MGNNAHADRLRVKAPLKLLLFLLVCGVTSPGQLTAQEGEAASAPEDQIQPSRARGFFIDRPLSLNTDSPIPDFNPVQLDILAPLDATGMATEQLEASLQNYSEAILELESSGNAWDQDLVQNLRAQAELYVEQGALAEAIVSFEKAVHINRINQGLHTPDQIADLKRVVEINIRSGNWGPVEQQYDYLLFLHLQNFGSEDYRLVEVLVNAAVWHTQLFTARAGETPGLNIRSAQLFYRKAISLIQNNANRIQELASYYHALATTGYLVATNPGLFDSIDKNSLRIFELQLSEKLGIPSSIRSDRAIGLGIWALEQLIARIDIVGLPIEDRVRAQIDLADWNLLAGRRHAATRNYGLAEEMLAEHDHLANLREELFAGVTRIPAFIDNSKHAAAVLYNPELGTQMQEGIADVTFDIARDGTVRNLEFLTERTEENYRQLNRLRAGINRSYFRPHIQDGATVVARDQLFRFRYWY